MCYGRIPVFINTDCVLPFEDMIDYKNHIVFVEEKELDYLPEKIKEFCEKNNLLDAQLKCRKIWENYLSPSGFFRNIEKIL